MYVEPAVPASNITFVLRSENIHLALLVIHVPHNKDSFTPSESRSESENLSLYLCSYSLLPQILLTVNES